MNWYESIKIFYDWGYYTVADVQQFVELQKITQAEAEEIINKTTE